MKRRLKRDKAARIKAQEEERKKWVSLSFLPFLFLRLAPSISSNPEGDALHALRTRLSDPNNVLQSWDPTLVQPLHWFHVSCDSDGHVVRLDLGNSNVSGTLGRSLAASSISDTWNSTGMTLRGTSQRSWEFRESYQHGFNDLCGTIPVDGPFASFPMKSFENNKLSGPELQGLVSYDFGC
ncbi:hypothetical protein MLD38_023302 [Melastoma candidum]|uniref:Uncharacterized protein n=1 Tax=Melastoma candidum TaxID=119954 RepID=A0ACB9QQJ6_9MYRT|nr:hypothetical protein MLD38_023302 [Melastoma candidum]